MAEADSARRSRARSGENAGPAHLARLLGERRIVICAGSGGVGKTTTAAALALEAAAAGRRACVVTIDPARRLADALGLAELTNDPHRVDGDWPGELWALMLDTKTTFDEVVATNARSAEQASAIYENRFYRNISAALSGTQEYMAMEKLYELHQEDRFDVVVVDTPPTRRALDFLDAPARLTRLLDNRIFRMLMRPTRASLRAINMATQVFLRTVSRVIGGEVVRDAVEFFETFEGMEQGFRDRAQAVLALLSEPVTAWLLIAAPRRDAVDEALFFAQRLGKSAISIDALVVNRVYPYFGPVPKALAKADKKGTGDQEVGVDGRTGLAALVANLAELDRVAEREGRHVDALVTEVPDAAVIRVPHLDSDVHDLEGLARIGRYLVGRNGDEPALGT